MRAIQQDQDGYLAGQLLIAMPQLNSPPFNKSVIYLCAHNAEGAMGLVINRAIPSLKFSELLEQLDIALIPGVVDRAVLFGGPVETSRGFVLHSADRMEDGSLVVNDRFALTSTIDILRHIAEGDGPSQSLLALGYAGWGPGQLDAEIQANAWLSVEADDALVFDLDVDKKWRRAIAKIGVDVAMLSGEAGHA